MLPITINQNNLKVRLHWMRERPKRASGGWKAQSAGGQGAERSAANGSGQAEKPPLLQSYPAGYSESGAPGNRQKLQAEDEEGRRQSLQPIQCVPRSKPASHPWNRTTGLQRGGYVNFVECVYLRYVHTVPTYVMARIMYSTFTYVCTYEHVYYITIHTYMHTYVQTDRRYEFHNQKIP